MIKKRYMKLFLMVLFLVVKPALAALTIEITEGVEGAVPIAIVPFGWNGSGAKPSQDVAAVIQEDLGRSGRFKTLPDRDMLSQPTQSADINFRNWRALGQEALVIGFVREAGPNQYSVEFKLYDVYKGEQLIGYSYTVRSNELRRTAHQISDLIYKKITGESGSFASRIAYITVTNQPEKKRKYKLMVADADGFEPKNITTSPEPLMSPAWSPDGQKIAYVSFEKKQSAIYIQTLVTGRRERIAAYPGINGAPTWSPDGNYLAFTLSKGGNPDIYSMNLASRKLRQLTRSFAIDTEPSWSKDGKTILFTSDRGGNPQIYSLPVGGGKAKRLTFEGDYNARGVFSSDGKQIAMVHRENGGYRIAVLDLQTGGLLEVSKGPLDESPSFAPNGSMILYATRDGNRGQLAAVSADGAVRQVLLLKTGEVREPAWSP